MTTTSFAGGEILSLQSTNAGFAANNEKSKNIISVCGFDCPIVSSTENSVNC